MQNDFSPAVYPFKPLSTSTKKDKTTQILKLVTLQQFLKNILKYQKLLKCASIFFLILQVWYKYIQMNGNVKVNNTQPFFPVLFKANTCNAFLKNGKLFCAQLCRYYEKVSYLQNSNNFLSNSSVTAYILSVLEFITLVCFVVCLGFLVFCFTVGKSALITLNLNAF